MEERMYLGEGDSEKVDLLSSVLLLWIYGLRKADDKVHEEPSYEHSHKGAQYKPSRTFGSLTILL
jgi:hypothetical protein